jgi:hypothetical protein
MRYVPRKLAFYLLSLLSVNAFAGDYSFTTGAEYTRGDYGTTIDTSQWYIPFKFGYTTDQYALSVTIPYVRISGSEEVLSMSGSTHISPMLSTTSTTMSTNERTDSGLGDVLLSGTYQLQAETKADPWIAVTGKIKLGTASEDKNLGTGENDYAAQLELAQQALSGYVGYKIVGDTTETDFDNVFYGAAGVSFPAGKEWKAMVEYYAEQAALAGADNLSEVSLTLSKPLSDKRKLSLYMIKGLSDGSPDWGMGVNLQYLFK